MDISDAITVHLKKFSSFHVDLNKFVKLSTAAFDYLAYKIKDPKEQIDPKLPKNPNDLKDQKELSDLIADLIKGAGQRWYPTNYVDPQNEIADLKIQLTESAIMRVYSSFEVFLDEINGSYSEYVINDTSQSKVSIMNLFNKYEWPINNISYLIPIYSFYNILRHCIVHKMGVANQELIAIYNSSEFIDAINNWPTVIPGGKLSPPPNIDENKKFSLSPHHAIVYSDICYRVASEINSQLVKMVGYEYIVRYVAIHQLLNANELKEPHCKNSYAYISRILVEDYKIKNVNFTKIKKVLENEDIRKQCYQKHKDFINNINA